MNALSRGELRAQWAEALYTLPWNSTPVQSLGALQSLVYLAATVGLFSLCKQVSDTNALCALVFFGGFLLTLLFEGKSQYTFFVLYLFAALCRARCVLYHSAQGLLRKIAGKRTA